MALSEPLHAFVGEAPEEGNAVDHGKDYMNWSHGHVQGVLRCKAGNGPEVLQDDSLHSPANGSHALSQHSFNTPTGSPSPHSAPSTLVTERRPSKAARALQHLGEACRRLSEVSRLSSLSAVTNAVFWVMPSRPERRASAGWPLDLESAPELLRATGASPSGSVSTPPRHADGSLTPAASPTRTPFQPPLQLSSPLPQRKARHPSGLRVSSASTGRPNNSPLASDDDSGAADSGGAHSVPSRRRASVVECAASERRLQPPPPPLPPPHSPHSPQAHALTQAQAQAQAGLFKPRPMPVDGLLYLAAAARSSMWSPERGARWSLRQYELARGLYRGYASRVYKAVCRTSGQTVALKVYSLPALSDFLRHQVVRELDIHSRLNKHPGVVQLLAAFREGEQLVLVLEYVRGGTLEQARRLLGGRMPEQRAAHLVVLPLLRVLGFVHRQGVVHRDIKPENLLFTPDWRLKLIDFGVALSLEEERAVTRAGSRAYMAPEVHACPLKHGPADNKVDEQLAYGAAADVWSLGAVVYELLVGFTPFPAGPPPGAKRAGRAAGAAPGPVAAASSAAALGGVAAGAAGPAATDASTEATEDAAADAATAAADAADAASDVPPADGDLDAAAEAAGANSGTGAARGERSIRNDDGRGKGGSRARAPALVFPASVSPAARAFISACLEPHPGDRPTVERLLQHPWLQGAQQGCAGQPAVQKD